MKYRGLVPVRTKVRHTNGLCAGCHPVLTKRWQKIWPARSVPMAASARQSAPADPPAHVTGQGTTYPPPHCCQKHQRNKAIRGSIACDRTGGLVSCAFYSHRISSMWRSSLVTSTASSLRSLIWCRKFSCIKIVCIWHD